MVEAATRARLRAKTLVTLLVIAIVAVTFTASQSEKASAADGSQFDPGYIISDALFFDRYAMTTAEIQAFLDSKIGTCTNGKCLNVLTVTFGSQTIVKSSGTGATICEPLVGGTMSAAEMIYRTQVACGISAKVILATLQKEQSLVSGSIARAPSDNSLNKAMGAACPDSGSGCDPAYTGFAKQIYRGALLFSAYRASAHLRTPGHWYTFQWKPNSDCGTVDIYIQNWATAALYNYTPYPPNQAALDNLNNTPSTGDACSSYGNRNFWRFYTDWFGDTRTGVPLGITVSRIGGNDRYDVAVGISQKYFPSGATTVYVAAGGNFPDALSGAPAAAKVDGPLLLVPTDSIPASVDTELRRLAPTTIIVTGGPASVSDRVLTLLSGYGATVTRITGADRYEVSRNVTWSAFGEDGSTLAYLATGATFPDALSASAAAGYLGAPVILIPGTDARLDANTAALLTNLGVTEVRIAGGPGSVSPGIEADLRLLPGVTAVSRLGGADRFIVSGATNRAVFTSATTVFVASGYNFPDALSGAAVAGSKGAPLYVIPGNCLPGYVIDDILAFGTSDLTILGGPASVTPEAASFKRCR